MFDRKCSDLLLARNDCINLLKQLNLFHWTFGFCSKSVCGAVGSAGPADQRGARLRYAPEGQVSVYPPGGRLRSHGAEVPPQTCPFHDFYSEVPSDSGGGLSRNVSALYFDFPRFIWFLRMILSVRSGDVSIGRTL